jgi:hypothetical protein
LYVLLHGLLVGLLLSALRVPLGFSIVEIPAATGASIARLRGGALFAIAALIMPSRPLFRRGVSIGLWLTGGLLGLVLHGLVVLPVFEPSSRLGFGLMLFVALPLFGLLSSRGAASEDAPLSPPLPPLTLPSTLGAALIGAGAALCLDAVARHVRLFSMGLPEDDTITGIILGAALLLGFLAFGRPHTRAREGELLTGGTALVVGAALLGPAAIVGLRFLGGLELDPFYVYLKRFGLDYTLVGTLRVTAVVAAAALVAPGFAMGLTFGGLSHPRRLRALLFGAAFGVIATPLAVRSFSLANDYLGAKSDPFAWRLAALGGALALAGACASLLSIETRRRRSVSGIAIVLGALVLTLGPRPDVWQASPWLRRALEPELLIQAPEGLMTVETEYAGEAQIVTLDRKRLTPLAGEESLDAERIFWSWSLLPVEKRADGSARVLFVGQMTPARSATFALLPPHTLERCAPWDSTVEEIEKFLFADESTPPVGQLVTSLDAEKSIAAGDYDLVVVAPIHGPMLYPKSAQLIHWASTPAPVLSGIDLPSDTLAVIWVDANSTLSQRNLPGPVIPAATAGCVQLSFGVVIGGPVADAGSLEEGRPILLASGSPTARPGALDLLRERPEFRNYNLRRAVTARFAAANDQQPMAGVAGALALHALPQEHSSPYDTRAEQIELSEEALIALVEASRNAIPDPATRRLWEGFAWLLFERRELSKSLAYLEPMAEAYGPWPLLERVVARAYQEFDMPEEACAWLERALVSSPFDIELLLEVAEWRARSGDFTGSAGFLEQAHNLQPGRNELRRYLGMMWVRGADPRGIELLTELLVEDPSDEEIARYLGSGPLPPLPEGFLPAGGLHSDE